MEVGDLRDREALQRRGQPGDGNVDMAHPRRAPRAEQAARPWPAAPIPARPARSARPAMAAATAREQQQQVAQQRQNQQHRKQAEGQHAGPGPPVGGQPIARAAPQKGCRDQRQRQDQQHGERDRRYRPGQLRRKAPADVQMQQRQQPDCGHLRYMAARGGIQARRLARVSGLNRTCSEDDRRREGFGGQGCGPLARQPEGLAISYPSTRFLYEILADVCEQRPPGPTFTIVFEPSMSAHVQED